MSAELQVTWDRGELARITAQGDDSITAAVTRAAAKGGRDAIRAIKAASTRSVRFRKRIKVRRVNDALPLKFPTNTKDLDELEWEMKVSGDPLRVSDYSFRQQRGGVSVAINAGKRSLISSAFVATMKSGHTGVFVRRGKSRLPIDELFSTRISDVFNDAGMIPAVLERGARAFAATIDRVLPLELAKLDAK